MTTVGTCNKIAFSLDLVLLPLSLSHLKYFLPFVSTQSLCRLYVLPVFDFGFIPHFKLFSFAVMLNSLSVLKFTFSHYHDELFAVRSWINLFCAVCRNGNFQVFLADPIHMLIDREHQEWSELISFPKSC